MVEQISAERPDVPFPFFGQKTKELIISDPSKSEALNLFSVVSSENPQNKDTVIITLPGIFPEAAKSFIKQKQLFRRFGNTVFVDYSDITFSEEVLYSQISDFIAESQQKKIILLGSSFGATCLIDFLKSAEKEEIARLHKIVLLGALISADDLRKWPSRVLSGILTKEGIVNNSALRRRASFFKIFMCPDPEFFSSSEDKKSSFNNLGSEALAKRAIFFVNHDHKEVNVEINVPTLLIWWEKEGIRDENRREIEKMFPISIKDTIKGQHGMLASSSDSVNPKLEEFLKS